MANEKRLIELDTLIDNIGWDNDLQKWTLRGEPEDIPTVDAVEVVHGEWEITEDDYYDLVEMKCSVCGESYGFEDYEDDIPKNYHYCPNCGAKMDGDGNA